MSTSKADSSTVCGLSHRFVYLLPAILNQYSLGIKVLFIYWHCRMQITAHHLWWHNTVSRNTLWSQITTDRSFQWQKYVDSAWHFVKFRGSPQQITVNSVVDSQLIENQLKISNVLLFVSVDVMPHAFDQTADKASKQSPAIIIIN